VELEADEDEGMKITADVTTGILLWDD